MTTEPHIPTAPEENATDAETAQHDVVEPTDEEILAIIKKLSAKKADLTTTINGLKKTLSARLARL